MDAQWPDAPLGGFPDSPGLLLGGSILPQDISREYKSFRDCGGYLLNEYEPVVLAQTQNDIGLEWLLAEDWTGGVVSMYAHSLLYPDATLAGFSVHGYVRDVNPRSVRMDFPPGVSWPVDLIVFRAKIVKTVDGIPFTHLTRGILVQFTTAPA